VYYGQRYKTPATPGSGAKMSFWEMKTKPFYRELNSADSTECKYDILGTDPRPGYFKSCWCHVEDSEPDIVTGEYWTTSVLKRTCSAGQLAQQQNIESELNLLQAKVGALETEMKSLQRELETAERDLESNACNTIVDALESLVEFLKSILCQIAEALIFIIGIALDKAITLIPGIGQTLIAMQNQPMCLPIGKAAKGAGKKAANVALKVAKAGVLYGYKHIMCAIKGIDGAQDLFQSAKPIAASFNFDTCEVGELDVAIFNFAYNLACGNIASAVLSLAKPAIMCNLPWKPDGGMCQTQGCIFG
jgi:hypothetical protein